MKNILNLCVDSFVKDGSRYRLDIYEQKTGKYRNFTIPNEVYQFVRDYAYAHNISSKAKMFPITERAVLKHLKAVCSYLGIEGVGSHSFRNECLCALHPNKYNQGVTPDMRTSDRELHWWYRAREQGADELLPDWIYDD